MLAETLLSPWFFTEAPRLEIEETSDAALSRIGSQATIGEPRSIRCQGL